MKARWEQWAEWLAERTLRERVILFVTLMVAVLFVWVQFVFTPLDQRKRQDRQTLASVQAQMEALATEMSVLEQKLKVDPNRELREEQQRLRQALADQKEAMKERLKVMVAPNEMADLLKRVLGGIEGLTLVSVRNLPSEPFSAGSESGDAGAAGEGATEIPVYKHTMELHLTGGFFDMLKYLRALEVQERRLAWEVLELSVTDFPVMDIHLVVQTLSLEKEWIGV